MTEDPRIAALPDIHGHAKGEHKLFAEERPIPYTARMLFLWFFHACRRGSPRFLMVADHMNYLTFEDPAAVNLVRRALKLAQAGDLYGAAETAGVEIGHAAVVSEGLRKGMRYSIGAEIDNDPRCRPDAQNIVDAMKPDGTVRSVHFIPITHPQHGENWMWAFDNPEFKDLYDVVGTDAVWEIYMATLLDAIDKLPGNIVGHFYVPAKFGGWPDDAVLERYEDQFVDACAERGMAIEINSRYFYKYFVDDEANRDKFRAAHLRLLGKAKAKNVAIAVGSDAHSPKDQGGAFDVVLALLDEAGVNEIAFPIAGRLARVALRATEEVLRAHAAALAPPPPVLREVHVDEDGADDDDAVATEPEKPAEIPALDRSPSAPVAKRKRPAAKVAAQASPVSEPAREPQASAAPTEHAAAAAPTAPFETSAPVLVAPKKSRAKAAEEPTATATAPELVPAASAEAVSSSAPASKPPRERVAKAPSLVRAVVDTVIESVPVAAKAVVVAVQEAIAKKPQAPAKAAVAKTPPVKAAVAKAPAAKPAPVKAAPVKAAPAKKTAAKPPAKKAAAKTHVAKPVAKKAGPVKKAAPAKKVALKKAAAKKPVAKKSAAKPAAKKAVAHKPVAKKTVAKKTAPKKAAAKKTPAKKAAPARKSAPKKVAKKIAKRR